MTGKKNDINRMDALTDGVFAIVATLLVLDIKLPELSEHASREEFMASLQKALPSFIAFAFSFLTVIIYWINHDHLSKWVKEYTPHVKYLNLIYLFWICLIPFPTKFISEYPGEQVAVLTYGLEFFMTAVTANIFYYYLAFRTRLLYDSISVKTRKKFFYRILGGPILYGLACVVSFIHVNLSIALFIAIPLLFLFLPKAELLEE